MPGDAIFDGLNPEQRVAVEAIHGPVVILAGAGTGKTTTITRRIAHQVRSGAFRAETILAVTFTTKAAGELTERLGRLGVPGVQSRTFHSTALQQVQRLGGTAVDVLESKVPILMPLRDRLPQQFRRRMVGDLAKEIERAKCNRLTPQTYLAGRVGRPPPIPPELMQEVFAGYEREQRRAGKLDFEDLLEHAIRIFETDERAAARFRERCLAVTVDEYQDVNLLQQTLLDHWLGDRDNVCVVGDDYQAIFGFTGASPRYLLAMRDRFAGATVVTLDRNYRSTPQVLDLANRLAPRLGGSPKTLRTDAEDGPEPAIKRYADEQAEAAGVAASIQRLVGDGLPPGEIAVLYRTRARSIRFELALGAAGVPYQVANGGLLQRPAARGLLRKLGRGSSSTDVGDIVERLAVAAGLVGAVDESDVGADEFTRQADLGQLVALADVFDGTVAEFVADLHERFATYEDADRRNAVRLSTLHLAKGLEWDAVFLPCLNERELPAWQAIEGGTTGEERRLLYVGITRARRQLVLSHGGAKGPSSFLAELKEPPPRRAPVAAAVRVTPPAWPDPLLDGAEEARLLAALPSAWGAGSTVRVKHHRSAQSWSRDEDRLLAHYTAQGLDDEAVSDRLGRRESSIKARRSRIGLG